MGKIIKYEFRTMFRLFIPLWLGILALSLVNRFTLNLQFDGNSLTGFFSGLVMFLYVMGDYGGAGRGLYLCHPAVLQGRPQGGGLPDDDAAGVPGFGPLGQGHRGLAADGADHSGLYRLGVHFWCWETLCSGSCCS